MTESRHQAASASRLADATEIAPTVDAPSAIPESATAVRTATVRVPATSSNLGSGFDCVGLAVGKWLNATVSVSQDGSTIRHSGETDSPSIKRRGTLKALAVEPVNDLLYVGFKSACSTARVSCSTRISLSVTSEIPVGRGLGSSAAATVAGAMLANEALSLGLTQAQLHSLAADIEGHADNAAAAIYGGAALTLRTGSGYTVSALAIAPTLAFIIVVPDFECDTRVSRSVLPDTVPYADAALAISRSAALVKGLETGNTELLAAALEDVLHIPYRSGSVAGFTKVRTAALDAGAFGATLSGAGSGMVAIATPETAARVGKAMVRAWESVGIDAAAIVVHEPAEAAAIIPQET
ncbi:MAG: homoserine kinase [Gemmatimonadaceae bacterium]